MHKPSVIASATLAIAIAASVVTLPARADTPTVQGAIGSQSTGAGAGKITFNPFSIGTKGAK